MCDLQYIMFVGMFWSYAVAVRALLESSWVPLGVLRALFGRFAGSLGVISGPSWGLLGPSWGRFGPFWGHLEPC